MSADSKSIHAMAHLLRQGATLTELSCPACSSPLFRLRGQDLWCERCQKRVIVRKGKEASIGETVPTLNSLESTLLVKIQEIERKIKREKALGQLQRLGSLLFTLLQSLEKSRKIRRT